MPDEDEPPKESRADYHREWRVIAKTRVKQKSFHEGRESFRADALAAFRDTHGYLEIATVRRILTRL